MAVRRLSREDAAILRLESARVAGHTMKIIVLDPPHSRRRPGVEDLRRAIAPRLDSAPELRQRLAPTPLRIAPPAWVDDERFDISRHVRETRVDAPVTADALRAIVAASMRERLDRSRPLWTLDVVDPLADGGLALVWKLHHAMADGTAAMRIANRVLWDPDPEPPTPAPVPASDGPPVTAPGAGELLRAAALDRLQGVPPVLSSLRRSPAALQSRARDFGRLAGALVRELQPAAGRSPLDAPISHRRAVAFASAPLAELRAIEKAHGEGVTVNDVVLAVVGGALRRWLEHRHGPLPQMRVRVPVSLHAPSGQDASANRDSFMCLTLPLHEPDPARRLLAINAQTTERKRHRDPQVLDTFFRDLGHGSPALRRAAERLAATPRVFALSVSNIAGPPDRRYAAGCPMRSLSSLAEIGKHHALRATAISYAGRVSFGLCADPGAVQNPETMAAAIEYEVEALRRAA